MEKSTKHSNCPHVEEVGDNSWEDVIKQKRLQTVCERCVDNGPNLWLCLYNQCLYVGCGEANNDCSAKHSQFENHYLLMNLTTMRIWCNKCENEVYKDGNTPPLPMREKSVQRPAAVRMDSCPNFQPSQQSMEDSSDDDEDMEKPRGLTGLQNIGNTCYMNAALQALSNCPPLTRFFLDCGQCIRLIPPDRKPLMARSFSKLLYEIWHSKRPAYVVPSSISSGIKLVHPMFRGFSQQDTQEFLRCFMDQLHEELKQPITEPDTDEEEEEEPVQQDVVVDKAERLLTQISQSSSKLTRESDNEYETCDSGLNSERSSIENSLSSCCEELSNDPGPQAVATSDCIEHSEGMSAKELSRSSNAECDTLSEESSSGGSRAGDVNVSQELGDCSGEPCMTSSPQGVAGTQNSTGVGEVSGDGTQGMEVDLEGYSPPITRSSVKKNREQSAVDKREQQQLGSTNSKDSGIDKSCSESSSSITASDHNNSNTSTPPPATSIKDVKETANIAQKQAATTTPHAGSMSATDVATAGSGPLLADRLPGRPVRHVQSDSALEASRGQTSGSPARHSSGGKEVSAVTKPRRTSENDRRNSVSGGGVSVQMSAPKSSHQQVNLRKKKATRYSSVISDTFDGRVLSSVQCLTCERISTTKETFQDLSLPIPSKDHLQLIHHSQPPGNLLTLGAHKASCAEVSINQGWFHWMFGWMRSWFWGPSVKLQDCLAAFFSADELKGDNMYSCEKCKKLRNGIKFSKVLKLPEILCIHLKRFRHEFMFSTKINTQVSFPMDGLDMGPYLHKDCKDQIRQYDLCAVICHHGTAGAGHYTSYCLNYINETWYEFDDQYVTAVDLQTVENCEAYVLFYRKKNDEMLSKRKKASEINEAFENSFMKFYISRQWINKFNMYAEPGPISNHDFLCRHGGVHPYKWEIVDGLVIEASPGMWEYLHKKYGGGPAVTRLYPCATCKEELDRLKHRQRSEKEAFIKLNDDFSRDDWSGALYAVSISWFKEWEGFVKDKTEEPPGPIENSRICVMKGGVPTLRQNSDYGQISEEMWLFFSNTYGGGPELMVRPPVRPDLQQQQQHSSRGNESESEQDVESN